MPQPCKVCNHPNRDAIDAELTAPVGRSLRALADAFGLGKDSPLRHFQNHLPQIIAEETQPDEPRQDLTETRHEQKGPATIPPPAAPPGELWSSTSANNPRHNPNPVRF